MIERVSQTTPVVPAQPADVPPIADEPAYSALKPDRFAFLRGSKSAGAAAVLLGIFALISRAIGLVRDKYIAYTFGAGHQTDAYNIAFNLPDWVNYLLIGGAASISFVTILSRYREQGREREGEIALSVILNTMALVLGAALLVAEIWGAPLYIHLYSSGNPAQDALAVHMTRILLPGQMFFFAGGVLASVALVRKQFGYQASSPLVYTLCIIVGGLIGAHALGIPALAWGALAGSVAGPFLVNLVAAYRAGMRWQPVLDFGNEGLREWVRMSIPMMLGVTVVFMDAQILQYFAKHETGDISRLMNAKKLFTAPMAIIGQAAGAASLPFFASLYSREKFADFRGAVNRSVSRIVSVGVLLTSAMAAMALPLCDLVLRGGRYSQGDARETASFLAIFSLSLAFWSAQAIYIRSFYAAGETLAPMFAGTVVTMLSLPLYWWLHARFGSVGLAWASDAAIVVHTVTLAILAHARRLVNLDGLNRPEISRCVGGSVVAAVAVGWLMRLAPARAGYMTDGALLLGGTALWATLIGGVLLLTGSDLPRKVLRRRA